MKRYSVVVTLFLLIMVVFLNSAARGGGDEVIEVPADFLTIQAALDSLDSESTEEVTIVIDEGVYNEKITIRRGNLTLKGVNRETTKISREVTDRWMTVWICNLDRPISNITIEDLTVENTNVWGGGGLAAQQALAIGTNTYSYTVPSTHTVTNVTVRNCTLIGYQDTVFIYPYGDGIVIENCLDIGGFDILSVWNSSVTVINSTLDSRHPTSHRPLFLSTAPGNLNERKNTSLSLIGCLFKSSPAISSLLSFNASDGSVIQSLVAENNYLEEPLASKIPKLIFRDGTAYPENVEVWLSGNNGVWEIPQTTRVEDWLMY